MTRDVRSAPAYLRQMVVNGARAGWREQVAHLPGTPGRAEAPDIAQRRTVLGALARLPAGRRACVVLRFYADPSEAQTAHLLDVSTGTVKSHTAPGLRQLQRLLEPDYMKRRRA